MDEEPKKPRNRRKEYEKAKLRYRGDCSFEGCRGTKHHASGLCISHERQRTAGKDLSPFRFRRKRGEPPMCGYRGCANTFVLYGYCEEHLERYRALSKYGGGSVNTSGYRMLHIPGHPNANTHGGIAEHRYVMSRVLGRPLLPGENVHHVNGDRLDNRPENLELWIKRQPPGQRVEDIVAWARQIIEQYGYLF